MNDALKAAIAAIDRHFACSDPREVVTASMVPASEWAELRAAADALAAQPAAEPSENESVLAIMLHAAWLMDNARDKLREVLKPFNDRLFDPYIPHMAEQAMSINREQLRRALSWMGVSIGDSSDEGFAADISTHVNRLTDAVEAMRQSTIQARAEQRAAPAAVERKPLTDAQIEALAKPFIRNCGDHWHKCAAIEDNGNVEDFARAVEHAHSIGSSKEGGA